jgi:hypothetical protein
MLSNGIDSTARSTTPSAIELGALARIRPDEVTSSAYGCREGEAPAEPRSRGCLTGKIVQSRSPDAMNPPPVLSELRNSFGALPRRREVDVRQLRDRMPQRIVHLPQRPIAAVYYAQRRRRRDAPPSPLRTLRLDRRRQSTIS